MKFQARLARRELPVDRRFGFIASIFISLDLALEPGFIGDTVIQTLTTQDTQLDLRHVEPTPMLRHIVKLQLLQDAPGFLWRERLLQRCRLVGVEIIHHNTDHFGFRILLIDQPLHLPRKILHRSLFGHLDM